MNPRRLAGSRRNKHLPIARGPRRSDLITWQPTTHHLAAAWGGILGESGASCTCGLTYDNFDRIGDACRLVERHIDQSRFDGKPDHAARAVDIHTIWPPLNLADSTAKQRKAAEAGARGRSAAPMGRGDRLDAYRRQNGRTTLTTRQWRQLDRMQLRAALTAAP